MLWQLKAWTVVLLLGVLIGYLAVAHTWTLLLLFFVPLAIGLAVLYDQRGR